MASVLFASQMGNSEEIAKQVASTARAKGVQAELHSMSELGSGFHLSVPGVYVFILSSTGDGEVPDTARSMVKFLRSLPANALSGMRYALLGLGDSNFSTFQGGPKTMDALLAGLGATNFVQRGIADEQAGLQHGVDPWLAALWQPLQEEVSRLGSAAKRQVGSAAPQDNPEILMGRVLQRRIISEPNAVKKIVELTIDTCGHSYAAGSNISVYPENDAAAVSETAARLTLDLALAITDSNLLPASVRWRARLPMTISDFFLNYIELTATAPKSFGQFFCEHLSDSSEAGECNRIVTSSTSKHLPAEWSFLALLRKFPSFTYTSLESLLPQLPPLKSRFYSISSTPLALPHAVTIAFGVEGVCSRYMNEVSEHRPHVGVRFSLPVGDSIFLKPVLDSDRAVFVSTGTGLSPFKGILEHIALTAPRPVWVFYGCRQTTKRSEALNYDFLYDEEVRALVERLGGRITTTASRSGVPGLKYVQDALRANSEELRSWNQVALICGSFNANEMKSLLETLSPGVRVVLEEWE